ncbi:cbb3-type cytochrome c oxidase subunit 3 [Pseudomonas reactans]|uniref:Cbb3-type cytochrome c oxidase subunit 3 n=1 Tax=Pseudomonas reactans TaxID=117680 RepID=A0ABX2R4L4_9PSED|nr:cbb3-type cytochrome c oxidase subunit 3 [Pseudomonas reactans]NWA43588.1 cbb3-type cytochrome c oxidase subunit 3 [Pseudomonas reactans]NWC88281.1 cbb3-type cytochrome c oxidase subunit 3 [Pseudomonas reactans]NWD30160.1 cbb3-type cytochrome c oxidase subunit 3 [Pseudomonas reactans]NWD98580.1 cbb3-type cytochrome c oxidase subunit 3 [Pseudomonas reactans]NWF12388.1 cbb3-type cytochrome c oxidase subunit 3 [Pseudomonas reactans]
MWGLLMVVCLYGAVEYCLHGQTDRSLDDASLMPFADDPEVARRVELATGKQINAVAPEEAKPGWVNLDM